MSHSTHPLRPFVITAALWLPAMFFLWFVLGSVVAFPVSRMLDALFTMWMPELIRGIGQEYHEVIYAYVVQLDVPGRGQARLLVDAQKANVLIYAYGLPLFLGLVMATPLSWARTFLQGSIGFVVLTLVSTLGTASLMLFTIAFGSASAVTVGLTEEGIAGAAMAGASAETYVHGVLAGHGLSLELIGAMRQFSYLILPAVTPVALWILLNRAFIESLVGWTREPEAVPAGPSESPKDETNS